MFITQGPVEPTSPLFVNRANELNTMQTWIDQVNCVGAILGARQTGKTSLLLQLHHRVQGQYGSVYIDLEGIQGATIPECYAFLAQEVVDQLELGNVVQPQSLPQRNAEFLQFLRGVSRQAQVMRIIILLDEIGALPRETAFNLSNSIRAVFTNRLIKHEYNRYLFVLCGAMEMSSLTTGLTSPLANVTQSIYLQDLSLTDTASLLQVGFENKKLPPDIVERVHYWTGGHPYWTQLLGQTLLNRAKTESLTAALIEELVEELLQTEDSNLPYVHKKVDGSSPELAVTLESIGEGKHVSFSRERRETAQLELIGLITNEAGYCKFRNR